MAISWKPDSKPCRGPVAEQGGMYSRSSRQTDSTYGSKAERQKHNNRGKSGHFGRAGRVPWRSYPFRWWCAGLGRIGLRLNRSSWRNPLSLNGRIWY